jgi:hypothetical protein
VPDVPRPIYGRLATLLVLGVLLLTVSATLYVFLAQPGTSPPPGADVQTEGDLQRLSGAARRSVTLLTVALVSALLILLFSIGAYLVIRVGQFVARERIGGEPTAYVDVWSHYRVSEEEIAAATDEEPPPGPEGPAGS